MLPPHRSPKALSMRVILLLLSLLLAAVPALAQNFDLPGLTRDSEAYQREISRRSPAGGSAQQRGGAETRAAQAERQNNWAAAAQAWEERIAFGDARADHWLALARAQMRRNPPELNRAMQAAWMNFQMVPSGVPEIPSLLIIAEALGKLDRPAQQIQALEAVAQRAPDNAQFRQQLADARRAAGLLVTRINTEVESEPARACLSFTVAPARRSDWRPEDWVRAEPPVPGMAVMKEGDSLCIAGLPYGRTTRLVLRAGLPGEDGLRMNRDTAVNVAMPNRRPRIAVDTRAFILARGQAPQVQVATVNLSSLSLRVVRITERNLVRLTRDWKPGDAMDGWFADDLPESWGRVVWDGKVDLPALQPNALQRVVVPLPEALRGAGPGLFVLLFKSGDGARINTTAALPLIATDLGLTAWRSSQGLAVQVRGLQAGRPQPGTLVRLLATNNDVLGEATTGDDGLVRFAGPLLRGTGPMAPAALHAFLGEDMVAMDMESAAFDLSDRGVSGRDHPGPLDAFLWLDRGIYRPGEVVNAAALLRDAGGAPVEVPARFRVRRPNGQIFAENVPQRQAGASLFWPIQLAASAPTGVWTLELLGDPAAPPIGKVEFRVDAFVPETLEVTMGPAPGPLVPGRPLAVPVTVRFLYGAPGAGLTGQAEIRLSAQRSPFPDWQNYVFGLVDENFAPDLQTQELEALDAQGRGTLSLTLPRAPDTTRPVTAEVSLGVNDPGGRTSTVRMTVPVRAAGRMIGIRPRFNDLAVDADAEAAFDIVALDADAKATAATLRARLVRERPDWRIVTRNGQARFETVWRDEPVDSADIAATAAGPASFARRLSFGRYRLEVNDPSGLAITSLRFRAGWAGSESAEVPDKVDVAADRRGYAPGETARIRITPPFSGNASIAVLTDRLVSLQEVQVAEGGTEVAVPVDAAWGPGAYIAVTVHRPGEARQGFPGRALGLAWVQVDPASRRLDLTIGTPERITPRQRLSVPIRFGAPVEGAMLTLAAVDEGILRLTQFATPDPLTHFTGKRRLGVDIRDDYGRLIRPVEGEAGVLRQGGDDFAVPADLVIPQRIVSLFTGPVQVAADGTATVELDIPDFAGEIRLMAVAWAGNRIGAAGKPLTVRDPVIAQALLPRFLAPGDEARLPVLLHNLDLPAGEVAVTLSTEGAISLAGPNRLAQALAPNARALPTTTLRATGAGEGVLRLAVTAPNGFSVTRESRITIRSSRPVVTEVAAAELPAGQERPLAVAADRFLPGSWRASARFGGPVRYDAEALLRALEDYWLTCLEQSSSRALAMAFAPREGEAGQRRAALLQGAVESILNRQRYDGSFALWSANGEYQSWLTAYAAEALLRAKAAGAAVPEQALEDALKFILEAVEQSESDQPDGLAAQAYRLHVLALAGRHRLGAARRLLEDINRLPTPLARAQLASAFARAGDTQRAEQAFTAALAAPARRAWDYDYGNASRDALAVAVLLQESTLLPARMAELRGRLPGPEYTPAVTNTQEQAWAVAAAAVMGRDGRPARVAVNGAAQTPATTVTVPLVGNATARNLGDAAVWQSVSVTGIPAQPLPAGRAGMRVTRRFFDLSGQPLNLDQLRQNTVFVLLLEGRAEDGQAHPALVQQGLPAGWEVVARLAAGEVPGMPWLGTLSETTAQPALDDRFIAVMNLTSEEPGFRVAVRLRAVTPGRFELPGAELSDMYRPQVFARQNSGRVAVQAVD